MKKWFILIVFLLFLSASVPASVYENITGRWAEKISERVVMDVYQDNLDDEYRIFITWREDKLAQKDIYRFKAKLNKNGDLIYKNGIHIYRYYNSKNKFEDKKDYTDGSGIFKVQNDKIIWTDYKDNSKTEFIRANKSLIKDTTVKNKMFSITLPEELRGFYQTEIKKDRISIYDKASKEAGFGGFAFGIKAYKNPADHATLPGSKKIGEYRAGELYDIVLKHPTDVQYDYTKNTNAPESYKLLYNIGEFVNIKGLNGKYYKNQGTKGQDLYKDVLKKHITAINEKWDSIKLEEENMSYMYNVLWANNKDILNKVGYAYYDLNDDGIDELLIGEIAQYNWKGIVYDIYTMVNRKPKHVISGGSRNRFYVCNDVFVCNEYSSGAKESGMIVYILLENSTELYPQVSFKYDGYTNSQNPWFISYGNELNEDKWENVSEEIFNERKQNFNKYKRFNFIPLDQVKL